MFELRTTSYVVALLISTAISAVLALAVWRRRTAPGGMALFWLMLAMVEWQLTGACEAAAVGTPAKILWSKISYVGTLSAPVFLFIFALRYSQQEKWLTRRNLALLWLIPIITFGLAVTNEWHHLIWTSFTPSADPAQNVLIYGHGTWFWIMVAYVYLLLSTAALVLIRAALLYRHLYRRQAALVLLAMPFPWIGNILYVLNWGPFPGQDLTLVGFAITGALLTLNLYPFRLLDLVPMARDALIENMSDGVLVLDMQNRIVDLNPAAQQIIGRPAATVIGQPVAQVLSDRPDLVERYHDVTEAQAEIALGEGEARRTFDLRISSLHDRRDHLSGRLIVLRDITERKRAEEALLQRQLRLSVLNQMGRALAGTFELARIYRIAYEHVAQLVDCPCFGISLYDPTTLTLRAEFMLDDGELIDAARFPPLVMDMEPTQGRARAIATHQPEIITNYPAVLEKATGDVMVRVGVSEDEHDTGAAMYVPMVARGQVIGLLEVQSYRLNAYGAEHAALLGPVANQIGLSIQNARLYEEAQQQLAERKRAEETLKEYSERLEEMVEERTDELRDAHARLIQSERLASTGRLAVSVAHEINNPLQGITNYLSLISQQVTEDDPLHENLDMVKLGFDRITEIVRRLRAFYRPVGEGMEPTDINGVVERVLALVGHQLSLGNVEVKTELAEQELPVLGSAGQLEQVLVNLALNAQNAMPEGGALTVRTTLHDNVVQLQMSDTGQGISEEEMSRLFKPFYSEKGGTGLGLGLWISHNIIEGHGGSIEVESQVGEGATFTISLPAYQRER